MAENSNLGRNEIAKKFNDLAAIKKQQAAEFQAREKAERDKSNILLRWKAIRNGTVLADESTQAELELYASVDDISLLSLDENGHICLLSSLQKNDQQAGKDNPTNTQEEPPKSAEETQQEEEVQETEAQKRRAALAAAIKASQATGATHEEVAAPETNGSEPEQVETAVPDSDLGQEPESETAEPQEQPEPEEAEEPEDNTPINEDAKVMRVENIGINEARVYIAAKSNADTNESAYGIYVEQGYGESRQVFVQGERMFNTSAKTMAFRAVTAALTPYSRLGQPIRQVYVFMDRELGWVLMQNSWNTVTEAYSLDAETYCQVFKACAGRDVTIRFAPAKAHSLGQKEANNICETLIHTPN